MKNYTKYSIKRATTVHADGINNLLMQVLEVHHKGRPDLFKGGVKKYTDSELLEIIADDSRPIFVFAEEGTERVLGYAFCIHQQYTDNNILTDIKTLYIDDICVDETERGKHIGKCLYDHVIDYAGKNGYYNVTLNVWSCNPGAMRFYEKMGMTPYKVCMEKVLKRK